MKAEIVVSNAHIQEEKQAHLQLSPETDTERFALRHLVAQNRFSIVIDDAALGLLPVAFKATKEEL